jgi:TPR repeat protein
MTVAVYIYRQAADFNDPVALYSLGNMYRNGEGVPKNLTEAKRFLRRAAELGHAEAAKMLKKL